MTFPQSQRSTHSAEIKSGSRFKFGNNWKRFLRVLNEDRILQAENSLKEFLDPDLFDGKTFLDIGCGSGLSSLVAKRLGAKVTSFDFDPQSVACTQELKSRYFPEDTEWNIFEGSALDLNFIKSLGTFDIVYSWGVLHHTGAMWDALRNAKIPTKEGGRLFIAIYNDAGEMTDKWKEIKIIYNKLPTFLQLPYAIYIWAPHEYKSFKSFLKSKKIHKYFRQWTEHKKTRGMSRWHDIVDWIGGHPYENAKADELIKFYENDGYKLLKIIPNDGIGNHQIVFQRLK